MKSKSCQWTVLFFVIFEIFHASTLRAKRAEFQDDYSRLFIGGSTVANIEQAPFTVLIAMVVLNKLTTICTGSIIHENWVLTAGHCVDGFNWKRFFRVVVGTNDLDEIQKAYANLSQVPHPAHDEKVQIRQLISAIPHPRFKLDRGTPERGTPLSQIFGRFDFALLEVDQLFFGARVNKIGLLNETWDGDGVPNEEYKIMECSSYGWGLEVGEISLSSTKLISAPKLRTSVFKIQHGYRACDCRKPYENRRLLCSSLPTEGSPIVQICPGDSGGPLVCRNKLAGVASFGQPVGSCLFQPFNTEPLDGESENTTDSFKVKLCGNENFISAWMYVCPVLGWIREHVPNTSEKPPSCRSPPLRARLTYGVIFGSVFRFYRTYMFE